MRTPLTLDADVAQRIERLRKARGPTLRDIVNQALREGLPRLEAPHRRCGRHATKALSLGGFRIGSIDDVAEALAVAEGDGRADPRRRQRPLVYAQVSDFDQHTVVRAWLDERLNGRVRIVLPWPSVHAFLRLVTSPRIFARPEPVGAAWQQVEEWLDCEPVWAPHPSDRYREVFADLVAQVRPTGNLVPDTHLAALALDHGCAVA